jgi:polysaccharide export outer membrane protein
MRQANALCGVFQSVFAACMVLGALAGCGTAYPPAPRQVASPDYSYLIGPLDTLHIIVWRNPELSTTVPVRPDGKVSLPLLNDVPAAGLTPTELRGILVNRLTEYIPNPEVSVIVREVHSFKVSVIGEVRKPDRYELKSRATVLDVLAMAGGFNEFAARTRIVVLRYDGAAMKRVPFNYNAIVSANGERANFLLQPGDIVLVP